MHMCTLQDLHLEYAEPCGAEVELEKGWWNRGKVTGYYDQIIRLIAEMSVAFQVRPRESNFDNFDRHPDSESEALNADTFRIG